MLKEKVSKSSLEPKNKKWIWLLLVLLVGGAGAAVVLIDNPFRPRQMQRKIDSSSGPGPEPWVGPGPGPGPSGIPFPSPRMYTNQDFPLKLGSGGNRVANIQRALNLFVAAGLKVDGKWGARTNDAMKRAMKSYPTIVPKLSVSEGQYAQLMSLYKSRGGTLGAIITVYALDHMVGWNSDRLLTFSPGELLGEHIWSEGGFTTFKSGSQYLTSKSSDVVIK